MIEVEICVNGVPSAIAAQAGGAHRIELCDNLVEGGTTPSIGTIAIAQEKLDIPIHVMIRPRGGDFCYSDEEFAVMKANIKQLQSYDVAGVVFGILLPSGKIDLARCQQLIDLAKPMKITFHRAFDMTRDPFEALDDCLDLEVDIILTSGHQPKVPQGIQLLKALQEKANNHLQIMPGSGVTIENANEIVNQTAVSAIHVSSAVQQLIPSTMTYQNAALSKGSNAQSSEYQTAVTSADRVKQLVNSLK